MRVFPRYLARIDGGIQRSLLTALLLCACGGAERSGHTAEPTEDRGASESNPIREVFGEPGQHLPRERLLSIASVIHRLEADPYGPHAPGMRFVVTAWLIESPDVTVELCPFFAGAETGDQAAQVTTDAFNVAAQRDVPAAVFVYQYSAGMAAYVIEHPGSDPGSAEVQVAGLKSMLRVYEITRRRGLADSYPGLDRLAERRDRGELLSWYAENVRCGS